MPTDTTCDLDAAIRRVDRMRGHKFFPPKNQRLLIPALYATDSTPLEDKIVRLHYFTGGADWYIFEIDDDNLAFGWCRLFAGCGELGYVDLNELAVIEPRISAAPGGGLNVRPCVERDLHLSPTRFGDLDVAP